MSDDERIARLTEIAQRVWSTPEDQPVTVQNGLDGADTHTAFVLTSSGYVLDVAAPNDRALDALEAALLVLVGQDRCQSTIDYATAMLRRAQTAEAKLERVRAALVEHSPSKALAILDDKEGS